MEIDRQHIIIKKGTKIMCLNELGQTIVAELQCELCCWPEGVEKIEVKQLDVVRKKENESSLFRSDGF